MVDIMFSNLDYIHIKFCIQFDRQCGYEYRFISMNTYYEKGNIEV